MDVATIRELYQYNRWANARTVESAAAVPADSFTRELGGSFGSLRGTLAHILGAEWIWLERWRGVSPRSLPPAEDFPDPSSIRERWREVEAGQRDVLESLDAERLAVVVSYVNPRGEAWAYPLGRMMQHVVNHSTYHRGQVATLLRQLGVEPLSTDLLLYDDMRSGLH
ncbi:MAG: DinB family protein [Acidobacteriota bacterium]|nr:DinB family protein [Acidobacteriota bacterium]MDQ5873310.1 DinB family protein [Acidobacteriota bacterium]